MNQCIDMNDPLERAHWCGSFSCTDEELATAVRVMDTTDVALVGLYLATRFPTRIASLAESV